MFVKEKKMFEKKNKFGFLFLDGRGAVDVADKVDHHKYIFPLLLTGLWSSSFSSNQLLILLAADPSSQRPWPLFQLLSSVLGF